MAGMQQFSLVSAAIVGVEAVPVEVEVVITSGIPGFAVVGMPDAAIQEARERVRAAIRASGFSMPREKILVNLAPGSLKKSGSGFDLPVAVGILAASGQIPRDAVRRALIVGELSLDGSTREVRGVLAYQSCARDLGLDLICPDSAAGIPHRAGVQVLCAPSLSAFRESAFAPPARVRPGDDGPAPDFSDVGGHAVAKRALEVAACGRHGVIMIGPPGSGKTMLASRLPSILPPLTEAEAFESARIHSIAGKNPAPLLAGKRPFRAPHHSVTLAGLTGGGRPIHPGEISLAHNGVLFLDELAEFKPSVLQSIRQPMEEGRITVVRANESVTMPSRFMLVAASNPCPCGYFGDDRKECRCSPAQVEAYQGRIGGPLMDRMDIAIDVWREDVDSVMAAGGGEPSAAIRERVMAGRRFARRRRKGSAGEESIAKPSELLEACALDAAAIAFVKRAGSENALSGRGMMRTLRIARTVADLEASEQVRETHVAEAMSLRMRGRR